MWDETIRGICVKEDQASRIPQVWNTEWHKNVFLSQIPSDQYSSLFTKKKDYVCDLTCQSPGIIANDIS